MDKILETEKTKADKNIIDRKRKSGSRILLKIVFINIINVILIIAIFLLLSKLPGLGESLKEIRSKQFVAQGGNEAAVLRAEVQKNQEKIDNLQRLFVNRSGFSDFIGVLNTLQNEGIVSSIIPSGNDPVENTKKQLGIPIAVEFQGSEEQINNALERIYDQAVLFRTLNSELEIASDSARLRINIFLLTDEQFSQN